MHPCHYFTNGLSHKSSLISLTRAEFCTPYISGPPTRQVWADSSKPFPSSPFHSLSNTRMRTDLRELENLVFCTPPALNSLLSFLILEAPLYPWVYLWLVLLYSLWEQSEGIEQFIFFSWNYNKNVVGTYLCCICSCIPEPSGFHVSTKTQIIWEQHVLVILKSSRNSSIGISPDFIRNLLTVIIFPPSPKNTCAAWINFYHNFPK